MSLKKIQSALISVYYKDGLEPIIRLLHQQGVTLYSTGGTQSFIEELGIPVIAVEDLTGYPSIFGGRVKTLHPKVFGGILYRRDLPADVEVAKQFEIPALDLVMVDLYPFEETVASGASDDDIIEKIVNTGHSRFPVINGEISEVIGVFHSKDLIQHFKQNNSTT